MWGKEESTKKVKCLEGEQVDGRIQDRWEIAGDTGNRKMRNVV